MWGCSTCAHSVGPVPPQARKRGPGASGADGGRPVGANVGRAGKRRLFVREEANYSPPQNATRRTKVKLPALARKDIVGGASRRRIVAPHNDSARGLEPTNADLDGRSPRSTRVPRIGSGCSWQREGISTLLTLPTSRESVFKIKNVPELCFPEGGAALNPLPRKTLAPAEGSRWHHEGAGSKLGSRPRRGGSRSFGRAQAITWIQVPVCAPSGKQGRFD
jgi:hypothetical protein